MQFLSYIYVTTDIIIRIASYCLRRAYIYIYIYIYMLLLAL